MSVPWGEGRDLSVLFQDQVARDLDIPYHAVKMTEYEEWHRCGLELDPRVLREEAVDEVRERLHALSSGCVFRA